MYGHTCTVAHIHVHVKSCVMDWIEMSHDTHVGWIEMSHDTPCVMGEIPHMHGLLHVVEEKVKEVING